MRFCLFACLFFAIAQRPFVLRVPLCVPLRVRTAHTPSPSPPTDTSVDRYDQGMRTKFLKMVSGLANMPPGGLERLTPSIKVRPSRRLTATGAVAMPTSHVCTFEFKLPQYNSRDELARLLRTAIEFGHCGEFVFS